MAAPSTIPEALPAVTKPSLSKAVGSPARSSMVVSGRRWSSRSTSFARLPFPTSTGATSSASCAVGPRLARPLLGADGELVLLLAADAVVAGQVVARLRHVAAAVGVHQGDHQEVLELPLAQLEAAAGAPDHVRRLRHVLHAADQAGRGVAGQDGLGAGDDRLDARAAQAVDGERRHLLRHAGLERHVAGAVDGVRRGLEGVAHDGVVDLGRVDARPLEEGARRVRPEVDRGDVGEGAVVLGHRGTHPVDQDQVTNFHQRPPSYSNVAQPARPPPCGSAGASG